MVATEAEKIRKQVNFYFSDSNLPYDKFLWTLRANTPEGCKFWFVYDLTRKMTCQLNSIVRACLGIPLETIASFKKMKMITEDFDTIVKALKEVESDIYQVDEEGKNIRRKSEVVQQNHVERSIYVKGLPLVDADAKDPIAELFKLQDKVDDFFSEKGYTVLCVRMKKNDEKPKKFKVIENRVKSAWQQINWRSWCRALVILNFLLLKRPRRPLRKLLLNLTATSLKFCTNLVTTSSRQSNTRTLLLERTTRASMLSSPMLNSPPTRERTKVVSTRTPRRQRLRRRPRRRPRKSQLLLPKLLLLLLKSPRRKSKFIHGIFYLMKSQITIWTHTRTHTDTHTHTFV